MKENIVVIGAGGFGREVAAMLKNYLSYNFNLLGFIDDGISETQVNNLPVLGNLQWLHKTRDKMACAIAIGKPGVRNQIVHSLQQNAALFFPNIIHPNARLHDPGLIKMGRGNIICDGTILTTNIALGNFNIINLLCSVGHDSRIGDFCSIMPGANVSGGARLMDRVYIGTGAKLIKATSLGDDCLIGAGSVVNTDVPSGATYVGIPARDINS